MSQEASVDTDILVNDDTVNDMEQDMDQVEGVGQVETTPTMRSNTSSRGKRKMRKERSKCWIHFEKIPASKDGGQMCGCKYCKEFSCASVMIG